jgi:hypothetical protein
MLLYHRLRFSMAAYLDLHVEQLCRHPRATSLLNKLDRKGAAE